MPAPRRRPGQACSFYPLGLNTERLVRIIDRLKFGVSPEGQGHDCYRTWEYLALGMIPIVQRSGWYGELHDGLPVVELDSFNTSNDGLGAALREFVASDAFRTETFDGWSKLFLGHWWRQVTLTSSMPRSGLGANASAQVVIEPRTQQRYVTKYAYTCKPK